MSNEMISAIEKALVAMRRIYQAGYDRIIEFGGSCDTPDYMMAGDPTARELRALLAQPAEQHQGEPIGQISQHRSMGLSIGAVITNIIWSISPSDQCNLPDGAPVYLHPVARHHGDPAGSLEKHMEYMRENIALKKRIAELETMHQGEPVAMVRTHGSEIWEEITGESLEMCKAQPEDYEVRTLYIRPAEHPAPVAVVLPERKSWDGLRATACNIQADAWNACLDEVARLNPPQQ